MPVPANSRFIQIMSGKKDYFRRHDQKAAVFIDFDNLLTIIDKSRINLNANVSELLVKLQNYLSGENRTQTSILKVYADFDKISESEKIQHVVYEHGAEPRFVPSSLQLNAAEIQLCIEAMEVLHTRPDIDIFVLVAGTRAYLPLIRHVNTHGRTAVVIGIEELTPIVNLNVDARFVDITNFLDVSIIESHPDAHAKRLEESESRLTVSDDREMQEKPFTVTARPARAAKVTYKPVTSHTAYRTLELIEEHFGQYDEIFLTPLLRKLSDAMNDPEYDPKTVINELEQTGAVWLEKRQGHPYDYTVLLIDSKHPDASQIQEMYSERNRLRETYGDVTFEDFDADGSFTEEDYYAQPVSDESDVVESSE